MSTIFKLLFLIGITSHSTTGIIANTYSSASHGKNLKDPTNEKEVHNGLSLLDCHILCGSTESCQVFNHHAGDSSCEIISEPLYGIGTYAEGWTIFKKVPMMSDLQINPCLENDCSSDSVCVSYSYPQIVPATTERFHLYGESKFICLKNTWLKEQASKGFTHCYMQHFADFDMTSHNIGSSIVFGVTWKTALENLQDHDQAVGLACRFDGDRQTTKLCIGKQESIYTVSDTMVSAPGVMTWFARCVTPSV